MSELNNLQEHTISRLVSVAKGTRFYELQFASGEKARLYIVTDGIFRFILDPSEKFAPLDPELTIPINDFSLTPFEESQLLTTDETFTIKSSHYSLRLQKNPALFSIFDDNLHRYRLRQKSPLQLGPHSSTEILIQNKNEFYYGGGMQNGHFSHKGHKIEIANTNLTGPDGVALPESFFWSNAGFAELRNTWKNGLYNFSADDNTEAIITHNTPVYDAFYLIGDTPADLIKQYYTLTGSPLFLPKYALGLGYIGNFTNTFWKSAVPKERSAVKFEDGINYQRATSSDTEKVYPADLNGNQYYQFSARAMIERYLDKKLPLKWIVPNYQNNTKLDEDEVKSFENFAQEKGITVGYYNQLPKEAQPNLVIAKTDSPKIGNSKLLQNIAKISNNLVQKNSKGRPWVMATNGWSAIQTLATTYLGGVGGEWEQIATQVSSFIGLSLSGQPNIGSAIDGRFSGGNAQISVRDLQWKVFTPLLFNIDGDGTVAKTPFAYNAKITKITQAYFKLRSQLIPYLYSLTRNAQEGMPVVRALFLSFPHEKINYTNQIKHEFMLGDNFLVAPITNGREDGNGNSIKDDLYLPNHRTMWIDALTGQKFLGGRYYSQLSYPLWHLPVFIRGGAIIQQSLRKMMIFPQGKSSNILYDDDGISTKYQKGESAQTQVTSEVDGVKLNVVVKPTTGSFTKLSLSQTTELTIMADHYPGHVEAYINDTLIDLPEYKNEASFNEAETGYFFKQNYMPFKQFGNFTGQLQPALLIKVKSHDISEDEITIKVDNFNYGNQLENHAIIDSAMSAPRSASILTDRLSSRSITVSWINNQLANSNRKLMADIEVNGIIHTNISGNTFTFHELTPNTRYRFRIRNKLGNKVSDWTEYFGTMTKPDQLDYAIKNLQVKSNLAAEEEFPLSNLTDLRLGSEWVTSEKLDADHPLELTFTFDNLYKLSRMVYIPRSRDHKGHLLRVQYAISKDGEHFEDFSKEFNWPNDAKNKVIGMRDLSAKAVKLRILLTTDGYASAKEIFFFTAKD